MISENLGMHSLILFVVSYHNVLLESEILIYSLILILEVAGHFLILMLKNFGGNWYFVTLCILTSVSAVKLLSLPFIS